MKQAQGDDWIERFYRAGYSRHHEYKISLAGPLDRSGNTRKHRAWATLIEITLACFVMSRRSNSIDQNDEGK